MDKKSRILFIYPNERGMSVVPPAIAILSQLLKQNEHITDLFDTTFYDFDDEFSLGKYSSRIENTLQVRPVDDQSELDNFKKQKKDPIYDLRKKIKSFNPDLLAVSCTCSTQLFSALSSGSIDICRWFRIYMIVSVTKSTCCSILTIILLFTEGLPGPVIIKKLGNDSDISPR